MRRGPKIRQVSGMLGVVLLVAIGNVWAIPRATVAQPELCVGVVAIANGGFESPDLRPGEARHVTPHGWASTGTVMIWGEASNPDNSTQFASVFRDATLSQTIYRPELAGSTVTISFTASEAFSSISVRFDYHDQRIVVGSGFATYTVTVPVGDDDFGPYSLSFEGINANSVEVDNVAVTFAKPCPTPTPSPNPTEPSGEEVEITVTGDPRFPVTGSVALETPGLSYTLRNRPDQGSVVVNRDGSFTYTAASRWVMFDQFTVVASNHTVITVNLVLEVDPPVPSFRDERSGGSGTGDPGSLTTPQPTPIPDGDDSEDGDSCTRCN